VPGNGGGSGERGGGLSLVLKTTNELLRGGFSLFWKTMARNPWVKGDGSWLLLSTGGKILCGVKPCGSLGGLRRGKNHLGGRLESQQGKNGGAPFLKC